MRSILFCLLQLSVVPAIACSFPQRSVAESYGSATSVFRAKVTEVRLASFTNPENAKEKVEMVEAQYDLKEVYKGTPPAESIVRDLPFGPGNCSLGLYPGLEYVFFSDKNAMVLAPTGSFGFFNDEGTDVKPKLQVLRGLAASKQ